MPSIRPTDRQPGHRRAAALLGILLFLTASLASPAAAVSVSPLALYLDQATRTGTLTLYNPGPLAEEVEIGFAFGYPVSDSVGNVGIPLADVAPAGEPSAVTWLRAFLRRLRLEPGQRQVVRVMAQPPAGIADGEYWARVLIRSRGGQPPIEESQGAVTVQLNVETVFVAALSYRRGDMSTGVAVSDARATAVDGGVELQLDLKRQGSAAYLGAVRVELLAPDGSVVASTVDEVAVYRELRRRFRIPFTGKAGPGHRVRYTLETERPDLPPGGPIRAPSVAATVPLT